MWDILCLHIYYMCVCVLHLVYIAIVIIIVVVHYSAALESYIGNHSYTVQYIRNVEKIVVSAFTKYI